MATVQHNRTTVVSIFQVVFFIIINVPLRIVFAETVTYGALKTPYTQTDAQAQAQACTHTHTRTHTHTHHTTHSHTSTIAYQLIYLCMKVWFCLHI